MRSALHTFAAVVTLTLAASAAGAQAPAPLAAGARLRLDLATGERSPLGRPRFQSVVGTLEEVRGDTLLLALRPGAASLRVARASVHAAYASGGRPARWRAALAGSVVPAVMGAALTTAGMSLRHRREGDASLGSAALSSAAWGAATGALLSAWSPKERWHRLPR